MAYRTIVAHMNDERRAVRLLSTAVALAARHRAELIGLHVLPGPAALTAMVVPYGAEIADSVVASDRKAGKALEAIFQRETAGQPFPARWLEVETMEADLCSVVLLHARAADLIVACQVDPDWVLSDLADFPERLALESGRPILMVPNAGAAKAPGGNVVVAWNGSREAARAVFDALPLLTAADVVNILTIEERRMGSGPAAETIARTLARHGVPAQYEYVRADGGDAAEVLRARAQELGADVIVMGAYGHSRWREYVFGGVTRGMTHRAALPILLSH